MPIQLDIQTGIRMTVIISAIVAGISLFTGIRAIQSSRKIKFFRMRRDKSMSGWRQVLFAIVLGIAALLINTFGEPVVYSFYQPSPTPTLTSTTTLTPTITLSPTITLTPSITNTPSESYTPTITPTPAIPLAIEALFEGTLTPPVDVVYSSLTFSAIGVDDLYQPIQPSDVFTNPLTSMYAVFSYDKMQNGIQWTALWYRNGELVNYETTPWDGGSGGFGYSDWAPEPHEWIPGDYQVQLFIGYDWISVGQFTVVGVPDFPSPTPGPSLTNTGAPIPTTTPSPTLPPMSPTPSRTPVPPATRAPTATRVTPSPTATRAPTATPTTPQPTNTKAPTASP